MAENDDDQTTPELALALLFAAGHPSLMITKMLH
jgi:hypothetical protein